MCVYIYIYIERERGREREIYYKVLAHMTMEAAKSQRPAVSRLETRKVDVLQAKGQKRPMSSSIVRQEDFPLSQPFVLFRMRVWTVYPPT